FYASDPRSVRPQKPVDGIGQRACGFDPGFTGKAPIVVRCYRGGNEDAAAAQLRGCGDVAPPFADVGCSRRVDRPVVNRVLEHLRAGLPTITRVAGTRMVRAIVTGIDP